LSVARHIAKIMTWDEALAWRRGVSGPVVFTNGVFDLLHAGHIDVLAQARAQGDALIVGLNSDRSVQRLKGPQRPIQSEAERAYVLAALRDVDAVVTFSEDTPLALIRRLRPDVLVKGGDYEPATVVGRDDVESWGGRVVIVPLRPGQSTTAIIEKLRAQG
jgi:rfaE bifunctional protein nucleotidyltransferase chain/domain